ncbi:hypothetical protein GXP70_22580 [Paenibacillus lycopersici]|uniref:Uncharacterized protein n=1 Tax=Paenibacillus lycopersici TaxID=2704462 RepID=A0A6C0FZG4_9BACL|nr:hypothetical protein [Paenibacillus lycopersici]QHT62496.1 hypothetical protein GXP70_22580 [Paenibacillus lycopersici]
MTITMTAYEFGKHSMLQNRRQSSKATPKGQRHPVSAREGCRKGRDAYVAFQAIIQGYSQ